MWFSFEADPLDALERVIERVVERGCLDATPSEYVQAALAAQQHTGDCIRGYLNQLGRRIELDVNGCNDR